MHRHALVLHRTAAAVALLVQLLLHSGIAWRDARAEGAGLRQRTHVEALGVRHAELAHAADCAVSQHLQAHSAPAPRLRAPVALFVAVLPLPAQRPAVPPSAVGGGVSSRGPPLRV